MRARNGAALFTALESSDAAALLDDQIAAMIEAQRATPIGRGIVTTNEVTDSPQIEGRIACRWSPRCGSCRERAALKGCATKILA